MTIETQADAAVVKDAVLETLEGDKSEASSTQTELEALRAELAKEKELKKDFRKYEKAYKETGEKLLNEQGRYKELYEAEVKTRSELEGKIKAKSIDSAIQDALKDTDAKSIQTVMKLIDKNKIVFENDEIDVKSIQTLIKELKLSDPILFGIEPKPQATIKKAGEGDLVGGYAKEIRSARSQTEVDAISRKYGVIR